jgi:hypothetical protein
MGIKSTFACNVQVDLELKDEATVDSRRCSSP